MRKTELPALTGVRFYAAFLVFLSHVVILPGMEAMSEGRVLFNMGVVGVSFFFVLSGFILTYNYADAFNGGVSTTRYAHFLWDRLTKIYPVHLATLLLVAPIAVLSPNHPIIWGAVPFHLLLLQCFWPSTTPAYYDYLNNPSWSISCEWFFYLIAPMAIFGVLSSRRRRVLIIVAALAYAVVLGWVLWRAQSDATRLHFVSWFAPSRFPEFLVGIFLGRFFLSRTNRGVKGTPFVQGVGIALIITGALVRPNAPWPFWGGLLYVPGSTLLIWSLANGQGWFANHLSRPWLNRLGVASFSLYLVHGPVLRYMKNFFNFFGWRIESWPVFVVTTVGAFIIVQTAALVLCYWYELPTQRRLRRLLRPKDPAKAGPNIEVQEVPGGWTTYESR